MNRDHYYALSDRLTGVARRLREVCAGISNHAASPQESYIREQLSEELVLIDSTLREVATKKQAAHA